MRESISLLSNDRRQLLAWDQKQQREQEQQRKQQEQSAQEEAKRAQQQREQEEQRKQQEEQRKQQEQQQREQEQQRKQQQEEAMFKDLEAAKNRLQQYADEQGLAETDENFQLIKNFVETSPVRGYWSREIVDVAVANLGPRGTNQLTWRKAEPPPPAPPESEPSEVLADWQ
jgi:hypothetical protein